MTLIACPCHSEWKMRGTATTSGSWPAYWNIVLRLAVVVLVCCASLWMVTEAIPYSVPLPSSSTQQLQQQHQALELEGDAAISTTPRLQALLVEDMTMSCSRDVSARIQGTARAPGDGGYRIRVIGLQQPTYAPGQVYTVELGGTYAGQQVVGFYLVAVPRYAQDESIEMGTFQHFDQGSTAFDVTCPHRVTNASAVRLSTVSVLWTAPLSGTGCLEFRATVLAGGNVWYSDGGALTLVLCEQLGSELTDGHDIDPTLTASNSVSGRGTRKVRVARAVNDASSKRRGQGEGQEGACCACGIAKYQLIFESLWPGSGSQHNDLPNTMRHWSSTIGASHSGGYSLWRYGDYASRAVQELCELGHVQAIERDLRLNGDNMRTVVKTPAIWWTEEARLHQSRWTQFSADRHNHVLSTLTRLGPSPDWCVGVSALDLCLPNCTWIQNLSVDLYLWDAGTNDALTFMAPHIRSAPAKTITRLTNTVPPPMATTSALLSEPVAALHLARIPDKYSGSSSQCDDGAVQQQQQSAGDRTVPVSDAGDADIADSQQTVTRSSIVAPVESGKCQVSEWSTWSRCSVTCGVGSSVRKRTRINGAKLTCAHLPMMEAITCYADVAQCPDQQPDDCAVTEWSEWSACSTSCGKGVRERRRHYIVTGHTSQCNRVTEERESCDTDTAQCMRLMAAKNFSAICRLPAESGPCRSGALRWYFDAELHMCMPFSYGGCLGNENRFQTDLECMDICERAVGVRVDDNSGRSSAVTSTVFPDEYRRVRLPHPTTTSRSSGSGKKRPLTRATTTVSSTRSQHYATSKATATAVTAAPARVPGYLSTRSPVDNTTTTDERSNASPKAVQGHGQPVDCQVSGWRPWSSCSSPCGAASYKYRRRTVTQPPNNGGKACPKSLTMRKQCNVPPCPKHNNAADCEMSEWSAWTPCTATCKPDAVQERVRRPLTQLPVTRQPRSSSQQTVVATGCELLVERRYCNLPPCHQKQKRRRKPGKKPSTFHVVASSEH